MVLCPTQVKIRLAHNYIYLFKNAGIPSNDYLHAKNRCAVSAYRPVSRSNAYTTIGQGHIMLPDVREWTKFEDVAAYFLVTGETSVGP